MRDSTLEKYRELAWTALNAGYALQTSSIEFIPKIANNPGLCGA